MKKYLFAAALLGAVTLIPAIGIADNCPTPQADPNGYLNKICHYLVAKQINVAPGSPERYKIKQVVEVEREGKKVIEVRLDCCHMGDIALIDKSSGEVIGFQLGPK